MVRQVDRFTFEFLPQFVNQVDFPLQPFQLPCTESKGKDGHEAHEQYGRVEPGVASRFVAGLRRIRGFSANASPPPVCFLAQAEREGLSPECRTKQREHEK